MGNENDNENDNDNWLARGGMDKRKRSFLRRLCRHSYRYRYRYRYSVCFASCAVPLRPGWRTAPVLVNSYISDKPITVRRGGERLGR